MLNQLALPEVAMLVVAALGIGFPKAVSRVSMLHVVIFAHVFGAKASTGIVLPMLIVGDILAWSPTANACTGTIFAACFRRRSSAS